ncbi:leucine-rich repeat flightless-interacting protein 1 isoform X6 [Pleurodeles waltl]|uniref:leucine-rich repeat flightless-interacting protein 1 isoform X6 n=1 Tax=Pleurodeles waltl TaxID=8319 RepID=UPI00370970B0
MEVPGPGGRKRLPQRLLGAEDEALNQIAREAEARLAAKRAARAEAREIRMKELERQQKEIYQVQKKYYGLDTKWGDIEQWMEDSERYSHRARRNTSVSDEDERMSVGSRGSLRYPASISLPLRSQTQDVAVSSQGTYHSDLGLPGCGSNSKSQATAQNGSRPSLLTFDAVPSRSYRAPLYDDSLYSGSRRYSASSSRGPSEYSCYLGSGSRASSRTSSARASPVVEERPDKEFNEKGSRTASSLSAATLASLGGTSSRRGSGDTSISVDTEASIREIKDISELKDQIQDVEGRYMQGLKEMKDSLAELEEKYKKAMVSNAQLDNEKTNFMYQVDTLKDVLLELEEQLAETQRQYEDKNKEFEREKHAHQVLQIQYNAMKESLQQKEEMLTEIHKLQQKQENNIREISDLQETIEWKDKKIGRHGIVLSSDLSPNGGILDGPYHERLVDSSTKGDGDVTPVLKTTGDGPLGRANQMKIKSENVEKVEKGQSMQSSEEEPSKKATVQDTEKALMAERTLHKDNDGEAGHARGCSDDPPSLFRDGLDENMPIIKDQTSKRDMSFNEDSTDGSCMKNDISTVSKVVECTNSDATEDQNIVNVENTGLGSLETESGVGQLQEGGDHEGELVRERESCSDDFQDAVEFVVEQKIVCPVAASKEILDVHETLSPPADEESFAGPLIESQEEGSHVQGILHNLGKHLDGFFDAVSEDVEGSISVRDENAEASNQYDQGEDVDEVVAETQEAKRNSPPPSRSDVSELVETNQIKEGDDSGNVEYHLNKMVTEEAIVTCVGKETAVEGDQAFKTNITKTEVCDDQGNKEVKRHVEVVDVEEVGSKAHSDEGEFFEFSNEDGAALDDHLGEEQANSSEHMLSAPHHEGTCAAPEHSSHSKEEGVPSIPCQQTEDEPGRPVHVGDGIILAGDKVVPSLDQSRHGASNLTSSMLAENWQQATEDSSQLNECDLEVCSSQRKADDEKEDEKQRVEGNFMTVSEETETPPEVGVKCGLESLKLKTDAKEEKTGCLIPDDQETVIHEKSREPELKEDDPTGETQNEDEGSFEFDDDEESDMPANSNNLYPKPVMEGEFTIGKEVHIHDSTEISVTKTTECSEFQNLQDQDILAPVRDDHHKQEGSYEAADQETEVASHSTSADTSVSEEQEAIEQSTKSTDTGNVSADPFEPQDLDNKQAYIKEDTLDRGIKRGKGKNKEDCLLS